MRAYDTCHMVTLSSIGVSADGVERRVIAPFDIIEHIERGSRVRTVGPRRWRHACRELMASNAPPGRLRSARHARMDLLPHQLEPALALLRGLGSRVLLADDVGLGKTLQAGLVAAELRDRGWADRILILTPAGVREQWAAELSERLAMTSSIVDATEVRRRMAALAVGVNPWATLQVAIASIDYVKRPEVLPAVSSCRWDIVIVDEAHGVTSESDRYRAVSALASCAAYVLLLTATPHSGDRRAFASLCAIGEHDCPEHGRDPLLIFRRSRQDVGLACTRRVHRLHIQPSAAEARMHALLARFARAVQNERGDTAALALSVLHKRALSSARSLEQSVARRLTALAGCSPRDDTSAFQFSLPLDEGGGELSPADEPPNWSDDLVLADADRERRLLAALGDAARLASASETKIRALRRLLRRIDEPVLIFTEYRDTLLHLRDCLGRPVVLLHGGLNRQDRAAALAEFSAGRCPVLLATDAAGEGLNLHHSCRLVVNLELPWNPMRLEQRIGRVDRIGQRRTVHAFHMIARHTREPGLLDRLRGRVARARADIDAPDPIGGEEERRVREQLEDGNFPQLGAVAMAEAARLADARGAPANVNVVPGADGPWLLRARHRATRARLQGRIILLFWVAYEDGHGHIAESTLVPMALTPSAAFRQSTASRHSIAWLLRLLNDEITRHVESAVVEWRADATRIAEAFTSVRLRRERAIAAAGAAHSGPALQPGLFDRRADITSEAESAKRLDDQLEQQRRIARIEQAAALSDATRLLLLVAP